MNRYYDKANRRLVYVERAATPGMWDEHWSLDDASVRKGLQPGRVARASRWLTRVTERYLSPGDGPILEGGCGTGQHVAALQQRGYTVIGLDFAPRTVAILSRVAPELDIRLGDVRNLSLEDASLAGYWSLGVIEHFHDGYGPIIAEMARVIRPGGYLFLTHPYMSPLRRLKVRLGQYEPLGDGGEPVGFYQFALSHDVVAADLARVGFVFCEMKRQAGLKGFKDEVGLLRRPLQALYDYHGQSIAIRGARLVIDRALSVPAGHTCLMVFRRS